MEPFSIIIEPGEYKHYKGGHYLVIGNARDSENLGELVVYQALYGSNDLWVRPLALFLEEVVWEGRRQPRFQRVVEGQIKK